MRVQVPPPAPTSPYPRFEAEKLRVNMIPLRRRDGTKLFRSTEGPDGHTLHGQSNSPRLKPLLLLCPTAGSEPTCLVIPAQRAACLLLYNYLAISMLTFTDPGTLKTSVPPLIFAIGITPGEGIDSPSWW